jgi:hypothetical protein
MKHVTVTTTSVVNPEMVKEFVEGLGWKWQPHALHSATGVVYKKSMEDALVFIERDMSVNYELDPEYCADAETRLGEKAGSNVHIGITGGPESTELALELAHLLVGEWGGIVDSTAIHGFAS